MPEIRRKYNAEFRERAVTLVRAHIGRIDPGALGLLATVEAILLQTDSSSALGRDSSVTVGLHSWQGALRARVLGQLGAIPGGDGSIDSTELQH
jgi:hypothetical protein